MEGHLRFFTTIFTVAILCLYFGLSTSNVYASSGDLDLTFGTGGKVVTSFGDGVISGIFAVARQNDNKIVVAGNSFIDGSKDQNFAIARYNLDGSLDESFGNNGKVVTDFLNGSTDSGTALAIQSDGKIVVVGLSMDRLSDFALARYNTNGSLDESFGNNGKVTTDFSQASDRANSIVIQPSGKLVVSGVANINGKFNFALARYNTNGSLDESFGNNGKVTTDFVGSFNWASSMIIQSDGKLVVAGYTYDPLGKVSLARYNTNGSLDESFGNNGKVVTSFEGYGGAYDLVIQPDTKLVVAGEHFGNEPGFSDFGLLRYNTDGSLDTTFGENGMVITSFSELNDRATSLIIQQNGKLVSGGLTTTGGDFALARYNTNGSLDTTFGVDGKVTTEFGNGIINDLLIQSDGKLVAVGITHNGNQKFALARYQGDEVFNQPPSANAGLDTTVNEGQILTFDGSGSTDPNGVNDIISYMWDFGDESVGNGVTINHTYLDNGIYTATLTVTDIQQVSDSDIVTIMVNNIVPTVSLINTPTSIGTGTVFTATATFTDSGTIDTHRASWDWGDGTTIGTVTENNGSGSVSDTHSYSSSRTYTISLTITDKDNSSSISTTTIEVVNQITALEPAKVWVGLKNSDDVGIKFDLMVEAYKDDILISSGQVNSVAGGSSGFNNAHLYEIPLSLSSPVDFPQGSVLSIKVYARNACVGSGKNSGHARLWFNDSVANTRFGSTIGGSQSSHYLIQGFGLSPIGGAGPKEKMDVSAGAKCSPFKLFGTWSTLP